jgi:hypothetical protein
MSESKNVQWPFVPADARPLFFKPEPNSQKAPVYTEPWIYADHRTRKRRHREVNSSIDEPPQPTLPQNHTTYASYLAEQSHLARKVRVTPYLLVNQNSQRFRVLDIGDHIVDWAVERLKPAAKYIALPWHCLIDVRHERLARKDGGERRCRHIDEQERMKLRGFKNVDMLIERMEEFMEEYQRRRIPRDDDESESLEESEFGDGDVEMEDAPPLVPPRPNLNPTVEDLEEDDLDDDKVEFVKEDAPSPPARRRNHTAPIGDAEFADLDDDEIDVMREMRQQYNANAEDLQDASLLISRLPQFEQQVDAAENEALPTAVQNGGGNNEERNSPPPVRDDAGDAGNESSGSSSDYGDDNEEGPAPPVRNSIDKRHGERNKPSSSNANISDEHAANCFNVDLRPIEPRPAPVLLPAHLIPAQIPRTTPVRNRHREESSTASVQGSTYAEYDRFQEMASTRPSPPITRRNTRIAGSRSPVSRSSTNTPATRTQETETPATTLPLFAPFLTSNDGAPMSFDKRMEHESTRTSSIWGTIIEETKQFAPQPKPQKESSNPPATNLGGEKKDAEHPSQDKSSHVPSSSAAKSAVASTPGNKTIVPETKVTAPSTPISNPAAEPAQPNKLLSNVFSRSNATVGSDPAMKRGLGDSILGKKKNAAANSSQPDQNKKGSIAPAPKLGLGDSMLEKKETNTNTKPPQADQKSKGLPAPKPQPNFGNNMLERKKNATNTDHSRPGQPTKSPSDTAPKPGLSNNKLEKKKNIAGQPTPPTQLPSFGRQSVRQHTYVDDDVPCPKCGCKNPSFAPTCDGCNISLEDLNSRNSPPRSRARKYTDWEMRDDEDGVVTYTGSRHQTLRHYPTEMTGGAGPEDTMDDFGDLIPMSKEEMEDLLARRKAARFAHTNQRPDGSGKNEPYYDGMTEIIDPVEIKERAETAAWERRRLRRQDLMAWYRFLQDLDKEKLKRGEYSPDCLAWGDFSEQERIMRIRAIEELQEPGRLEEVERLVKHADEKDRALKRGLGMPGGLPGYSEYKTSEARRQQIRNDLETLKTAWKL